MLDGIAIREAVWMEIDDDEPGKAARYRRLRIAASVLVDHLCGDYHASPKKVTGRGRDRLSVFVRAMAWAALKKAGYKPGEIANVFGRDITVVIRSNELVSKGTRFRPGRAPAQDLDAVLDQLVKLLENPPPFGQDELEAEVEAVPPAHFRAAPRSVQAMRARYQTLVRDMIRTDHARACRIWRWWCQEEYPHSWEAAARILPREYRLRHPDRLARAGCRGGLPEDHVQKSPEDATEPVETATRGACTTVALRELAHAR